VGDPLNQYPEFVRSRAVLIEYVKTLIQWGGTAESVDQADVLFNEAIRILGPKPITSKTISPTLGDSMTVSNFVSAKAPLNPELLRLYDSIMTDAISSKITSVLVV